MLATLSLAGDVANGLPYETSLRTCAVAAVIAGAAGCSAEDRDAAWYATLLRFLGCTAFAHEEALAFGADDVEVRRLFNPVDYGRPAQVMSSAWHAVRAGEGSPTLGMAKVATRAPALRRDLARAACAVGQRLADRLALAPAVGRALVELHERWDGRGVPEGRADEALSLPARLLHCASLVETYHRLFGMEAMTAEVKRRAGGHLDPTLCGAITRHPGALAASLSAASAWDVAFASAPTSAPATRLEDLTSVLADFVDLKTPYALGHSRRVADVATRAARIAGLDEDEQTQLLHAGRVHDLGHVSVGNDVWEHAGDLSTAQWERVRLHPYHGARALRCSTVLAPLGELAGSHHERCDGSGYPHGTTAQGLSLAARVLAVADVYAALREDRPHRPALSLDDAVDVLAAEEKAGRLDRRAVASVREAIGRPDPGPRNEAGLSDREVEVLVRVARGASNKDVARELGISAKTVQHHVRHVYDKTGVRSRAAIALFAIEHGLVGPV